MLIEEELAYRALVIKNYKINQGQCIWWNSAEDNGSFSNTDLFCYFRLKFLNSPLSFLSWYYC